jgi:glycine cleavage system regulatory protein
LSELRARQLHAGISTAQVADLYNPLNTGFSQAQSNLIKMGNPNPVSFVMTVLGADRPGLVESFADVIAQHDGNWLESQMAHLAGQFAGIVRVQASQEKAAGLHAALQQLPGLSISIVAGSSEISASQGRSVQLDLMGPDRPGIVRDLSRALAARGVNVEELETECLSAPMSGELLFKANARLAIPESTSIDDLRADLDAIANELTLDIDLLDS